MNKALLVAIALGGVIQGANAGFVPETFGTNYHPSHKSDFSNQTQVSGIVRDASGPVSGVTVAVVGTSVVVQTDENGAFSIAASAGNILRFSAIGYKSKDVSVEGSTANIVLENDDTSLDEVIVTALGIKREKRALGYAAQDIKADELMKNKNPNVINSLNGKIAGVNVTNSGGAPGASANIIIRGGTSLERDNQPLFVIDGVPMDNSTGQGDNSAFDGSTNASTTNGNRALDLNPEDIESVSVLKGPSAAALYGLRAAAGAIVITTKKGKDGATQASISSRFGVNWVNKLPEQQSLYKQGSYYNGSLVTQTFESWGDPFGAGEQRFNNMRDFYELASSYDNSFNISGGSPNGNFYLSGSNIYQTGVVPTTDFNRSTVRFNGEQKLGKVTVGANVSYSMSDTRKTLTGSGLWGSGGSGYMEGVLIWPGNNNMKDYLNPDGSNKLLLPEVALENNMDNPYWLINRNPQNDKTDRIIGNVYTNIDVADWFDITYRLGIDNYTTQFSSLTSAGSSVKLQWQEGMMSNTDRKYQYLNSNLMLNFKKQINDWDFGLLLGTTTEDTQIKSTSVRGERFENKGFESIENFSTNNQYYTQIYDNNRLIGVYGDLRVGYKNLAFINFTGRNDWSSTLPLNNRSFFYPSVSGSFIFTELFERNSILSFGKLRASSAFVGKDTNPYATNTYLFGPEETIGGGFRNHWTRGNDKLLPEKTNAFEVGADLRFLNDRLGLEFTYYQTNSFNQILQPRVSNATGYILTSYNIGELNNKGVEFTLNATPIRRENFTWNSTLNVSHNTGRVAELIGGLDILYVTDVQVGNGKAASYNDGDFMAISGSVWQTDDDGNLLLDYNTGRPLTTNTTTTYVGNREPDFIGGWNNSFTYKNWDLSFLFDFRKGGDIYNASDYLMTVYGTSQRTASRGETISFTGSALNPATQAYEIITREVVADEAFYKDVYSKHTPNFIENVNWWRLRAVSLSYTLPKEVLARTKFIKGATFNAAGNNLWLLTNYSGVDPETSAAGAGVLGSGSSGIDYAGVPATAGFTVGVNLRF
ncbi:SusC/RagA family TonB-linked outer membrane protein [Sphingobacterium griseoflavum]|uniref:SusC/RagA family TonB-linked outer membrane protein n=1 Tax=Sphingobacterium griseoflavum TaxID=1474952 RepID=A0ABQ3HY77_9SPHI|nr:SusC/RagA family TonB-linked outer membrane protein [Sphingobacterium griseoflavum]GHE46666.1 SusC/RagA family TonB-linked outer membrane protein [Sphingobacterium griseoflavum]